MKKLLKWAGVIIGSLVGLLIIGAIALPFVLPLEKIKELVTARLSEAIHREIKVEKVSFNLFSGIKLEKLSVSNREGFAKKPFVSADAIELRYAFWPLFNRQIIVKEFRLVKPEILIEKNAGGTSNYSDMTGSGEKRRTQKVGHGTQEEKKQGFSLVIDTFSVHQGHITYSDYGTKTSSEIKNANLTISGIALALVKPIDFKFSAVAVYQKKDLPLSLAGKLGIDLKKDKISLAPLTLNVAGEKADFTAYLAGLKTTPSVNFTLSSKKLSLDPLLALFAAGAPAEKKKANKGELTKMVDNATKAVSPQYRVNGRINIENLAVQNFKLDKVDLLISLANKQVSLDVKEIVLYDGKLSGLARINLAISGLSYNLKNLKLAGFNSTPFVNALIETFLTSQPDYKDLIDKVYGKLDLALSLAGQGVEPQDVFANAIGNGSFSLTGAELKRLKTLAEIGRVIKSNSLQNDIKLKDLRAAFLLNKRVLNTKQIRFDSKDVKANFAGGADLGNQQWVPGNRLSLRLSPDATKGLAKEFSLFRDKDGWFELTVEMTGSLTKPVPKPILDKPIEQALGKIKLKIEAKEVEIKQQVQTEIDKKAEAAKKTIEDEAKKKLKELIRF
ncbi:hypothetical protein A3J44_06390 [candidate division WOR-1 bacterium RIFCSPHIGHO2_02_FULL_45_12]|nr:MAG: hypothetical protein A3J44_06390 [candidate division WOR-1 bacterium RIFCSPHIGHO2_02_FULL_45_12]